MACCSRRDFHRIVLGAGAACALSALPTLAGCSSPYDGTVALSGGQVVLAFAQFPRLASAGGSVVVQVTGSFPLVIVRTGDTTAAALSATCTHAGCIVGYDGTHVHCPCHDADFALTGDVLRGPPPTPLATYPATVGADSIMVVITG